MGFNSGFKGLIQIAFSASLPFYAWASKVGVLSNFLTKFCIYFTLLPCGLKAVATAPSTLIISP